MKRKLFLIPAALFSACVFAQNFEVHTEFGQAWGGGSVVDINNDGKLDFYIAGKKNNPMDPVLDMSGNPLDLNHDGKNDSTENWRRMYFWDKSSNMYKPVITNLNSVDRVNLDWRDVDGDGYLDVIVGDHSGTPDDELTYTGLPVRGIFKNKGDGKFEKLNWPIAKNTTAAAFADFNMDGLLDYICVSKDSGKSAIFFNAGNGVFDSTGSASLFGKYQLGLAYVKVVDINNDGLPDFLLSGNVDNKDKTPFGGARVFMDLFINNPDAPGNFSRAMLSDQGVFMKANGAILFADVNSDGKMDMLVNGEGGEGTGEPVSGDVWACITHLYLGQGDGSFVEKTNSFINDIRPLGSTGVGGVLTDWNNDGKFDLIITGWAPTLSPATQAGLMYYGDGSGNFTNQTRVPGASETVLLLLDWNNDGVKDYLVSGHSWDQMFYPNPENQGRTGGIYLNNNGINNPPSVPSNLSYSYDNINDIITINWDAATDDKTPSNSLTYEYYLKNSKGFLIAPNSFVGGENDGLRKVVGMGNAYLNKSLKFYGLPDDTYTFGVQAIDASYNGSKFSTIEFVINKTGVKNNRNLSIKVYPNPASDYVKVEASDNAYISIMSVDGKVIKTLKNPKLINVSDFTTGIYIVEIKDGNKVSVQKLIIKK